MSVLLRATALAAPLLLAGCGGGGSATSVGPADASSTAPPASSQPAPDASADPSPDARAAVEQAVRAYVDAANVAMATGDTSALRALSTPECTCLRLAESIEELYGSGGRAEGARWDLEELTVVDVTGPSASVSIGFLAPAYTEFRSSTPTQRNAYRFDQLVALALSDGWRVADIDELGRTPA